MKTYGLRKKFAKFPGKVDYHIHSNFRKVKNWWEEMADVSKGSERQVSKNVIQKETEGIRMERELPGKQSV